VVAGTAVLKSEHYEQREFVSWFRKTYPDVRIFAIPNGGWRSRITAAKLKAEGASPGVPDLFIPAWLVWVEMKRSKGGMLSDKQKDWRQYLLSIGHTFILANGKEQAIEAIKEQAWTRTKP
jgi:rhodanese-related sulfurtransferase